MVGELQVTLNTCLCTLMSKRRVVIRSSTGSILYNRLSALNWLEYEKSLTGEVLERNRVRLLLSDLNKNVVHSFTDLAAAHTRNIQLCLDKRGKMGVFMCAGMRQPQKMKMKITAENIIKWNYILHKNGINSF